MLLPFRCLIVGKYGFGSNLAIIGMSKRLASSDRDQNGLKMCAWRCFCSIYDLIEVSWMCVNKSQLAKHKLIQSHGSKLVKEEPSTLQATRGANMVQSVLRPTMINQILFLLGLCCLSACMHAIHATKG